jgi:hypothetical protein
MTEELDFLMKFPKDKSGMYIVYELYTFDNLFRLLLKNNFDYEEALYFILANCSLSAVVFQERIHNKGYRKLSAKDALPPDLAARKAQLIYDFTSIIDEEKKLNHVTDDFEQYKGI